MITFAKRCAPEGAPGEPDPCACGHGEIRCDCGSLLAKLVGGEVELKCRRCKRTWRIPVARR